MKQKRIAIFYAILAAALYAINVPFSKLFLNNVEPTMMAAFLYLGAGAGLWIYGMVEKVAGKQVKREHLTRKELPYTIAMVVLDIMAPILLMFGLRVTNAANASLLNNFVIVATSIIALVVFKELISKKLWVAIALATVASGVLTFEGVEALTFNHGSLLVLGACLCWGFENNCTKMLSSKSSIEIVIVKGTCSGLGSLIVALMIQEKLPTIPLILGVLLLGFVAYGLSIHFYIMAQKDLGAANTSAYYAVAPFLGVAFGMIMLKERPGVQFYIALLILVVSTVLMVADTLSGDVSAETDAGNEN